MKEPLIIFTKCFYKLNITELVDKNINFEKDKSYNEDCENSNHLFTRYVYNHKNPRSFDFKNEKNNIYGIFNKSYIYIYNDCLFFIASEYKCPGETKCINSLCDLTFNFSHNSQNKNVEQLPDDLIFKEILESTEEEDPIYYFKPEGLKVKKYHFYFQDFDKFNFITTNDSTENFSYIFYYYPLNSSLTSLKNKTSFNKLKNCSYGNPPDFYKTNETESIQLNDIFSLFASRAGAGIIQEKELKNDNETIILQFYLKFLEAIKETVYYERKTEDFNSKIDTSDFYDYEKLNLEIKKERRKALHLKYEIKNDVELNNIHQIFYGKYLIEINFKETLDNFVEVCKTIEEELQAELKKQDTEHNKHIEKTLSVVTVFAVVGVIKDIAAFISNAITVLQSKIFNIQNIIKLISPLLCLIVITILLITLIPGKRKKTKHNK